MTFLLSPWMAATQVKNSRGQCQHPNRFRSGSTLLPRKLATCANWREQRKNKKTFETSLESNVVCYLLFSSVSLQLWQSGGRTFSGGCSRNCCAILSSLVGRIFQFAAPGHSHSCAALLLSRLGSDFISWLTRDTETLSSHFPWWSSSALRSLSARGLILDTWSDKT